MHSPRALLVVGVLMPLLAPPLSRAAAPTTVRVSVGGPDAPAFSTFPALSADGRYVAFASDASNLVPDDTNNSGDIFLRDTVGHTTVRVSVATSGAQANGASYSPAISADGRYVTFASAASNLVTGDTNECPDVFVRDTLTGTTRRVSVTSDGTQGNARSGGWGEGDGPSISADGHYIAFASEAENLVVEDTNFSADVFVHDLRTGVTVLASVSVGGTSAYGWSATPSLSGDGRYLAFTSDAYNLVSPAVNTYNAQLYVRDMSTGTTTLESTTAAGGPADGDVYQVSMSTDGRHIAFESDASNLVAGDTNDAIDYFVRNRSDGTIERVSVSSAGEQSLEEPNTWYFGLGISGDGRYVAFQSRAPNLVAGDSFGTSNVFVRDRVKSITTRVNIADDGGSVSGDSGFAAISSDGHRVAFSSDAASLVSGDASSGFDVFVRDTTAGTTSLISSSTGGGPSRNPGAQGNGYSDAPALSADGSRVAFLSDAWNLAPRRSGFSSDVFVHDMHNATTQHVSITPDGTPTNADAGERLSISADGRFIAFYTWASNLTRGDDNDTTDVFVTDLQAHTTTLISANENGVPGDSRSYNPAISADGRYVAFTSLAHDLLSSDSGEGGPPAFPFDYWGLVYIREPATSTTQLVSVASNAEPANDRSGSNSVAISADGRYVVFDSEADNLVPGDTNSASDIFVHDTVTGETSRASVATDGIEGNGHSLAATISADGHFVAFTSEASNLVPGDTNNSTDVFLRDLVSRTTTRISISSNSIQANDECPLDGVPSISADGRYVAFSSYASNLVPDDTNNEMDVFVRDTLEGTTIRVSVAADGAQGNSESADPVITADGRFVTFGSYASNLVPGDTNDTRDAFVRGPLFAPADATSPETQVTGEPEEGATVCTLPVKLAFTGTDETTLTPYLQFAWRVDGDAWTAFASQATARLDSLAEGAHVFEVKARDLAGNEDPTPAVRHFTVSLSGPAIMNVKAIPSAGACLISWSTDQPSTSRVEYGPTSAYGAASPENAALTTSHSVMLTGLTPGTAYHFRVHSANDCGHDAASPDAVFTTPSDTTAPITVIASGPADNGKACDANVTFCWKGRDDGTPSAALLYSWKLDGGAWSAFSAQTCHTFIALPEGTHTFQVRARDAAGNVEANPPIHTFFADRAAAVISNVASAARDVRADITWNTNEPATSQVEYGTSTAYGSTTAMMSTAVGAHTVQLASLAPRTTYHYRVRSSDGCRETVSPDRTFTTTDPLKPNLMVTDVALSSTSVKPLDTINVRWTVKNLGPGDTTKAWGDAVYLSTMPTLGAGAVRLAIASANNALPEQGQYTQTQTVQMPARAAGAYYVIVRADSEDEITESNESDNTASTPVTYAKVSSFLAVPDAAWHTLNVGAPASGHVELVNLRADSLTGIQATVQNAPANVAIQVSAPQTLGSLRTATLNYTLTAADESILAASPVIHLTSAQGEQTDVTLNLRVIPRRPQLVLTPGNMSAGMLRGRQTFVEWQITNTGAVAATGLTVSLPNIPWMALTTPGAIGDLSPGATTKIGLTLAPSVAQALGPYTGSLAVNGDNAGLSIPYTFDCVSTATGGIKVRAEDEFTYFAEDHPPVSGAHVTLTNPYTNAVVLEGNTDADGLFARDGITEGAYNVIVTANKHSNYQGTVQIAAGETKGIPAFLSRQLVTTRFTVIPVDTEDGYEVTLEPVFEANVPAPVITMEPLSLNVSRLSFDASGKAVVNFTVTNHGLVAAENNRLEFGDLKDFALTPAVDNLGTIAANTSVVVPVTIQKKAAQSGAGSGADFKVLWCEFKARDVYNYFCGSEREAEAASQLFQDCFGLPDIPLSTTPPPDEPPSKPRDPEPPVGDWQPLYIPKDGTSPDVHIPNLCDSCTIKLFVAVLDCKDLPSEAKGCFKSVTMAYTTCVALCGLAPAPTNPGCWVCAWELYQVYKNCSPFISDVIRCTDDILHACEPDGSWGPPPGRGASLNPTVAYLSTLRDRLALQQAVFVEFLGDPKWVQYSEADRPIAVAWFDAFAVATNPDGDGGGRITDAERQTLMSMPHLGQITPADVTKAVDRWNRTLEYYAAGIFNVGDVPAGQSTDFMAQDRLNAEIEAATQAENATVAEGYETVIDAIEKTRAMIAADVLKPKEQDICARVRIRLDQDVTMTRSAFKATLEMDNAPQNVPLTEIEVALDFLDATQANADNLFAVNTPAVAAMGAVDGTGALQPGATGSAQWTILPTRNAAPDGPTRYTVGGVLRYKQSGQVITVPLFPISILVKPDPFLKFHYFWQRDVYSDDPFTLDVEPAEPFSLGLLVENRGKGTARNLNIATGQPQIIENEKGLLIDFKLIGATVNDKEVSPALNLNLGDIAPDDTMTARWLMTSSLQGKFIEYKASFRHVDDLGNPKTSLIDSVDIHELEHVVRVDSPVDDKKPDFLANDVPDDDNLPDKVWLSDGSVAPVAARAIAGFSGPVDYGRLTVQMTASGLPGGFVYLRVDDPGQGNFRLVKVTRSDGKEIRMEDNAWTTARTIRLKGQAPFRQNRVHIFDRDSTGMYTLTYAPAQMAPPPVLSTLSPNWAETGAAGFTLQVKGAAFVMGDVVKWGTEPLVTQYVSATQLFADAPAARLLRTGPARLTVAHPEGAGGAVSNTLTFTVGFPKTFGDVNGDGMINMLDVIPLLRIAGGLDAAPAGDAGDVAPYPSGAARGYGDGRITTLDVLTVLRAMTVVSKGG